MEIASLHTNVAIATQIVRKTAKRATPPQPFSSRHNARPDALMTPKQHVPYPPPQTYLSLASIKNI
jgi:hypothetical protein